MGHFALQLDKENYINTSCIKIFQYSQIVYIKSITQKKIGSISFCFIFWLAKFHNLLRFHDIGINSSKKDV